MRRYAKASCVRVIIDAEDYFTIMQKAMLNARQRILLIGWDCDTRIQLNRQRDWWQRLWIGEYPARLGNFITWLANSQLLDPESPDEMFEAFAKRGLFRDGTRLARMRDRLSRKKTQ